MGKEKGSNTEISVYSGMERRVHLQAAEARHLTQVKALLAQQQLPIEDLEEGVSLFVWEVAGQVYAVGGWEQYGDVALLRSIAVAPSRQSRGVGKRWVDQLLHRLTLGQVKEVYLLTTSAEGFFGKLGFQPVDRSQVPPVIKKTQEFASLCPDTATVMHRVLTGWTEQDSATFIRYGDLFVPNRKQQLKILCQLIGPDPGKVLDLACGPGRLGEAILESYPKVKWIGLDASAQMREQAALRLASFGNRVEIGHFELAGTSWRRSFSSLDAVLASLVIHHLDWAGKQALFREVYQMLNPGRPLIIADLVRPTLPIGDQIAARSWDEWVQEASVQEYGDLSAFDAFKSDDWNYYDNPEADPIDQPDTLFDQLKALSAAGFVQVDVYWMQAGHAIFAGWKKA